MTNNQKVSVIVPSYKRHKQVFARAIESLLIQSYENIEIIIVDDNVGIGLEEYRNELAKYIKELKSNKIIYIQNKENLGSAKTRNVGVKIATGSYITFLDDDDKYLKDKIKNQISYMVANELDMSFCNQIIINPNSKFIDFREYRRLKLFDNKTLMEYHLTKKITGTNTFMIKKELFQTIKGFDSHDVGDEFYLMYKIIQSNAKIGYCDDTQVISYREEINSLSVSKNRMNYEKLLFNFIKNNSQSLSFYQKCFSRYRYFIAKAVYLIRTKKIIKSIGAFLQALLSNPISFIYEPIYKYKVTNMEKKKFGELS